jgi:hypothetical protein
VTVQEEIEEMDALVFRAGRAADRAMARCIYADFPGEVYLDGVKVKDRTPQPTERRRDGATDESEGRATMV